MKMMADMTDELSFLTSRLLEILDDKLAYNIAKEQ